MQKLYQNKDWLYNIYTIKNLSTVQVSILLKVNDETIRRWLHKFNIPVRSYGLAKHLKYGNHCQLSSEMIKWLNGELLGDGNLYSRSSYSANFRYGSKYFEYCQYVSDTLKCFGIEQSGKINKRYHKDRNCYSYFYQSRRYAELLPIRKQWYPEGKKIIPKDLKLTPLTLRQHYIGDGSLVHPQKAKPYIVLSTCGFSISDVEWLISQLNELGFKATRMSSNNVIHISTYSAKAFLNYIGECLVECYQYKWNY